MIAGDKLPQYLAGAYTLGDALADLCEVPACKAQLIRASSVVSDAQQQQPQLWQRELLHYHQQQQQQPGPSHSPFAQPYLAAEVPTGPGAAGDLGIETDDDDDGAAAAILAASVRVPQGLAIGSFSSKSGLERAVVHNSSHPSLLELLDRERQQQLDEHLQQLQRRQQQQQQQERGKARAEGAPDPVTAAQEDGDGQDPYASFADAYLDPPVRSADQLSLFTEVQRFVGRRRLRPVLHCMLRRMVFAMPFDDRIRITLDTDVRTTAVVSPARCISCPPWLAGGGLPSCVESIVASVC